VTKRITPNYKIESIQYEGGDDDDLFNSNYISMKHNKMGGRRFAKASKSPQASK